MISIIIPVYNEVLGIDAFIKEVLTRLYCKDNIEFVVVDGGSNDGTFELLRKNDQIKLVSSPKGRALQMNVGAKVAVGNILYFLHADSLPPINFDLHINKAIDNGAKSGCFKMKFDENHWLLNLSGWLTRFSSNLCRGGDQSLFVLSRFFDQIGAFDESLTLFEDNEIISRLKNGGRFYVIQSTIVTSARKYRVNGVVRLQLIFGYLHFLYRAGASQTKLQSVYNRLVQG